MPYNDSSGTLDYQNILRLFNKHIYFFIHPIIDNTETKNFDYQHTLKEMMKHLSDDFTLLMFKISSDRKLDLPSNVYTINQLTARGKVQKVYASYCQALIGCKKFDPAHFKSGGLLAGDVTRFLLFANNPSFFNFVTTNYRELTLLALKWEEEERKFNAKAQQISAKTFDDIKSKMLSFEKDAQYKVNIDSLIQSIKKNLENIDKRMPRVLYALCVDNLIANYLLRAETHCLIKNEMREKYSLELNSDAYDKIADNLLGCIKKHEQGIQASMFASSFQQDYKKAISHGLLDFIKTNYKLDASLEKKANKNSLSCSFFNKTQQVATIHEGKVCSLTALQTC